MVAALLGLETGLETLLAQTQRWSRYATEVSHYLEKRMAADEEAAKVQERVALASLSNLKAMEDQVSSGSNALRDGDRGRCKT